MSLAALSALPGVVLGRDLPALGLDASEGTLPLGFAALERVLPTKGLPEGQITELSLASNSSFGTTLGLMACREALARAVRQGGEAWCAFIDPLGALHAPSVQQMGVALDHLLVVRPPPDAVARVAIKLAEARAFSVIVIDNRVSHSATSSSADRRWSKAVRRLVLAVEKTKSVVLLLTNAAESAAAHQGAAAQGMASHSSLPVGLRIHLARHAKDELCVRVTKDKYGRITEEQRVRLPTCHLTSSIASRTSEGQPILTMVDGAMPGLRKPAEVPPTPARLPTDSVASGGSRLGGGWRHPRNMRPSLGRLPLLSSAAPEAAALETAALEKEQLPLFGAS